MNKQVLKQIKNLLIGDLVRVEWYDASVGKSLTGSTETIDVPVQSYGIYVGVLGEKNKHIILAQSIFRYADGLYDIDYTAVPQSWASTVRTIIPQEVSKKQAQALLTSFLQGRSRRLKRRISNHEKPH